MGRCLVCEYLFGAGWFGLRLLLNSRVGGVVRAIDDIHDIHDISDIHDINVINVTLGEIRDVAYELRDF
ncbi:MAG: hypothetical protein FWD57_14875 [Polyangiaceae bacterium]|nr:hypothetical protein [Polyangiaceae bacterium]